MNEIRAFALSALLLLGSLAACSKESEAPPLEGAAIGGPFTLVNQDGRQVSDRDFQGKYRLVYFGFTYCPDVCPVDLQAIGQGLRQLERSDAGIASKVQPLFITVDPERDTPAVLKRYVAAFHPRIVGLTGSPQQIAAITKRYGVYYQKEQSEGSSEYLMNHSRVVLLFGPEGEPLAIVPHDQGPEAVAAELKRWVA